MSMTPDEEAAATRAGEEFASQGLMGPYELLLFATAVIRTVIGLSGAPTVVKHWALERIKNIDTDKNDN